MTITSEDLVRREVHHCVSYMVSVLARTETSPDYNSEDLREATEQAFELCTPIPDYEETAIQSGWVHHKGGWLGYDHDIYHSAEEAYDMMARDLDPAVTWFETAEEVCDCLGEEPHEREIFEHWIVSGWLADRLEKKGEKVDKDFMGTTVWARTTTGQAICMDSVIEEIVADLIKARNGVPLFDPEGKLNTAKGLCQ